MDTADLPEQVKRAIAELPSDGEWWKPSGQDEFEEIGAELISHGMDSDAVVGVLSRAYTAVAEEYGE